MKKTILGFLLLSLPAFAQTNPRDYYLQLAGHWAAIAGLSRYEVSYSVAQNRIRVQGETCSANSTGPQTCGFIDQDYLLRAAALVREYPQFGSQPVEILESTPTKLVKREVHPMLADRASITTEELIDNDTLKVTTEIYVKNQPQPRSRWEYVLKRTP